MFSANPEMFELAEFQQMLARRNIYATYALAALIVAVFIGEESAGGSDHVATLVNMGANSYQLVLHGQWWRLVSSIFLHGGYLHVALNVYVLFALGGFINRIFGNARFLLLFFVAGIVGSLSSAFIGHVELSVGASGALWGLFGASTALILRPSQYLPDIVRVRLRKITIINLVINLSISFLPMIDLWAHLGGGAGGFIVGILFVDNGKQKIWLNG